jgi:CRISPR/Cas system-associated endonuclease Cas1
MTLVEDGSNLNKYHKGFILRAYRIQAQFLLLSAQAPQKIEIVTHDQGQPPPVDRVVQAIYTSMRSRRLDKVAVMADRDTLEKLKPLLDAEYLEPGTNFHWSGTQVMHLTQKGRKRVQLGDYEQWYRWFMQHQRFRAFHIVVMVDPLAVLQDEQLGGYLNGFLARLMAKVTHRVIIVQTPQQTPANVPDKTQGRAALMAMLYGTRLSFDELAETARLALVPLGEAALNDAKKEAWLWETWHSRYQLTKVGKEFLEGMRPPKPTSDPRPIEPELTRKKRSGPRYALPKEMLEKFMMEDLAENGWITPYGEWEAIIKKIEALGHEEGSVIWNYFSGREIPSQDVDAALAPSHRLLRRLLRDMAAEGKLETRTWFREIGRPTTAYFLPGKAPFLDSRCGQCAFYVPAKRRCRLWWLVNKRQVFHDERWKQPGSKVTGFELHKMRWASRMGPHSSACPRFIDKKRDHNRKAVPVRCEVCGRGLRDISTTVTCRNCRTRYVRFRDGVNVMTAYEHDYNRVYHQITGSDAEVDLQAWRKEVRERLALILEQKTETDDLDLLAEEFKGERRQPGVRPQFSQALQDRVNELTASTDIARQFSMAMAESARNATLRIIAIARLHASDVGRAVSLQEKYIALIATAKLNELLTYEGLIMKEYWRCFGVAVKPAQQWLGPRKRSRFVREFVEDPAGRARGCSPTDAAINYLHQRRLRQAERINAEVGFPGTCDGFLHRERYNSRGIGLLLDMIDPFKFADREVLLAVVLSGGLSWRDFRLEQDRRGSTFYYPGQYGKELLDVVGRDADESVVVNRGQQSSLVDSYRQFARNLFALLDSKAESDDTPQFVYEPSVD